MAGIKIRKLQGATLLEVLVAIGIVITVFSISTLVFLNVTGSSFTGEKINSSLILNEISFETRRDKSYFDEELKKGTITVRKTVGKYENNNSLLFIHLSAYNESNKLLSERKEIWLLEEDE